MRMIAALVLLLALTAESSGELNCLKPDGDWVDGYGRRQCVREGYQWRSTIDRPHKAKRRMLSFRNAFEQPTIKLCGKSRLRSCRQR